MSAQIYIDAKTASEVCAKYLERRDARNAKIERDWKATRRAKLSGKRLWFGLGRQLTESEIEAKLDKSFNNAASLLHGDSDLSLRLISGWGTASEAEHVVASAKHLKAGTKMIVSAAFWDAVQP